VDRRFDTHTCPINWFLLTRSLAVLSSKGRRFPTMEPRLCEKRARAQDELWRKLNDQVATVRVGPIGLAPLAEWVKGAGSEAEVGILAQQVLGRLFQNDFTATPESWAAAQVLVVRQMRSLYADVDTRKALSAEAAAGRCLRAPVSVYRQSTAKGTLNGTAFPRNSLFVLEIGTASQLDHGRSLVFMEESWSRCPASTWIPAMLEGVWRRSFL
jgi:hypothetical protein